ncbi:uncharacterized protein LOC135099741 [Scylla paramamosain]|uniref:uncharacterized protein LOC135099741 n=1 Tax=Scylla paramamosain TaxID=85552 RepID=UPI00308289F8
MASEQKQVRILTKSEQRQTIKGIHKPKKNIIKNYLESPFALEWPELTTGDEEAITALIQKSCAGLRKLECKPPWKQVAKYKGAERKSFLKECHMKFLENLDPDGKKQNDKRKEALSHLIFGYNAVMRALEKDGVAGILVKKNVDPVFVTKSFLPGCARKCIPLVPLNDLDMILKDKETLSLSHACMALGLKTSVKEESNLFFPLYIKMCEALNVEEEDMNEDVCENELESSAANNLENKNSKCSYKLSETKIRSYHLKRNGKGTRAFTPHAQELEVRDSDLNMDFAGFKSFDAQNNRFRQDDAESRKTVETKLKNFNRAAAVSENFDFSSVILIDASGDENHSIESDKVKDKASDVEKLLNKASHKTKQKAKKIGNVPYVSAKTKRLKGNPNRKSKRK